MTSLILCLALLSPDEPSWPLSDLRFAAPKTATLPKGYGVYAASQDTILLWDFTRRYQTLSWDRSDSMVLSPVSAELTSQPVSRPGLNAWKVRGEEGLLAWSNRGWQKLKGSIGEEVLWVGDDATLRKTKAGFYRVEDTGRSQGGQIPHQKDDFIQAGSDGYTLTVTRWSDPPRIQSYVLEPSGWKPLSQSRRGFDFMAQWRHNGQVGGQLVRSSDWGDPTYALRASSAAVIVGTRLSIFPDLPGYRSRLFAPTGRNWLVFLDSEWVASPFESIKPSYLVDWSPISGQIRRISLPIAVGHGIESIFVGQNADFLTVVTSPFLPQGERAKLSTNETTIYHFHRH